MLSTRYLVFIEVAAHKSFSKAAAALFISQPAVSKHISAMEDHYHLKLFQRNHNTIELTPAGRILYEKLQQVKSMEEHLEFEISSLSSKSEAKGILKLGASTTIALYVLPKILSGFHEQYPQLEITLLNRNSELIIEALISKEINLGITEEAKGYKEIDAKPFINDQVVVVCSSKNTFARQKQYTLHDLRQFPIALRERGSGTLAAVKKAIEKRGVLFKDLNVKVKLGGTEALKNFIVASDCIGFLPLRSVERELKNGQLRQLFVEDLLIERKFFFVKRKKEAHTLSDQFIRFSQIMYNLRL
jgi:DNA-binding transcriptional LysR family regulator